jgi:cation transport regulator ChaB
MDNNEKDFLLAEFNTAWDTIQNIDIRRGTFARYYSAFFVAVLAIVVKILFDKDNNIGLLMCIELNVILLLTLLVAVIVKDILKSEREANIKYRKKINLIREIFLAGSNDEKIIEYLKHSDIGIKVFSQKDDQPTGDGKTLKGIYELLNIEEGALIGFCIFIWVLYWISTINNCGQCGW